MQFLQNLLTEFNLYAKEAPMVAGALSLWVLGAGSLLLKNVPMHIFDLIAKHLTTRLTIFSSGDSYYKFVKWYVACGHAKDARALKITNGRWGGDEGTKSIGYGVHYFWHDKQLIQLNVELQKDSIAEKERDVVTLVVLGRSHKLFDSIFADIQRADLDKSKIRVFNYQDNFWHAASEQYKRSMDTIFIDSKIKNDLIQQISAFYERADLDIQRGIPHQLGIMLYGPPGTGKTSIIKALASHFDKSVFNLKVTSLTGISTAFANLPENAFVCIEDIDTETSTNSRSENPEAKKEFTLVDLSDILNSIDGLIVNHGRVLIATTNHINKLDPALIRPGRFDIKIEIGYMTTNSLVEMLNAFYDNISFPTGKEIKPNVTTALVQQRILQNPTDPDSVIGEFTQPIRTQQLNKPAIRVESADVKHLINVPAIVSGIEQHEHI